MDRTSSHTPGSSKCSICLGSFENQSVGSLQNCPHVFCLQCLIQWAQTSNTCPVDRTCFTVIHQRRCPGGDIQNTIKVTAPKKPDDDDEDDDGDDDDEEEGSHLVLCERCGRGDDRLRLLVCSDCDSGCHMSCLTPSLTTRPAGDWLCPECVVDPQRADVSTMDENISDGELTDLLAEAAQTGPATSTRLRPSTLNRPSGSTQQRRSRRIRGRAEGQRPGPGPGPRPQTSWHVPRYLLLQEPKSAVAPEEGTTTTQSENNNNNNNDNSSVRLKSRKRRRK